MAAQSTSEHVCFNRPAARPLLSRRLHLRRRRLRCHGCAARPIIVKSSRTGKSRASAPSFVSAASRHSSSLHATGNPQPTTHNPRPPHLRHRPDPPTSPPYLLRGALAAQETRHSLVFLPAPRLCTLPRRAVPRQSKAANSNTHSPWPTPTRPPRTLKLIQTPSSTALHTLQHRLPLLHPPPPLPTPTTPCPLGVPYPEPYRPQARRPI